MQGGFWIALGIHIEYTNDSAVPSGLDRSLLIPGIPLRSMPGYFRVVPAALCRVS